MTELQTEIRNRERQEYWSQKYLHPDWPEDIHFALFTTGEFSYRSFVEGVALNTAKACEDILDRVSVYRASQSPRMLDFACGAGDLIINMCRLLPKLEAIGIDISPTAIELARGRMKTLTLDARVTLTIGGLEELQNVDRGPGFDIISCRDAFYMLDLEEQNVFLSHCKRLLNPGGILYIADLVVHKDVKDELTTALRSRQKAGDPISWWADTKNRSMLCYSLLTQVVSNGLVELGEEQIDPEAVRSSYSAASLTATDVATKAAYKWLSELASRKQKGGPYSVVYVRFYFTNLGNQGRSNLSSVGFKVSSQFSYPKGRPIFREGDWYLPEGEWTLIVGRSGVGKTTFVKFLSGDYEDPRIQRNQNTHEHTFVLSQHPELVEGLTVTANMALFSQERGLVEKTLNDLGFDKVTRNRLADDNLSGGERQRVALGQAIVAHPSLLVLDEPCKGIDRVRRILFFATLRERHEGETTKQTVVCVDHDFEEIKDYFDNIYEMLDGWLIRVNG